MTNRKVVLGISLSLIALQIIDIGIHVGTAQAEPIRILSNAILGVWAIWSLASKPPANVALIAIGSYLLLNASFLAMYGITNPNQGGALRVTLFALVGLSTALAFWLNAKADRD